MKDAEDTNATAQQDQAPEQPAVADTQEAQGQVPDAVLEAQQKEVSKVLNKLLKHTNYKGAIFLAFDGATVRHTTVAENQVNVPVFAVITQILVSKLGEILDEAQKKFDELHAEAEAKKAQENPQLSGEEQEAIKRAVEAQANIREEQN